jgi:hypothetical protein
MRTNKTHHPCIRVYSTTRTCAPRRWCTYCATPGRSGRRPGKQASRTGRPLADPSYALLYTIRQWFGFRLPGRWRWHTLAEAEAYLRSLEDDEAKPHA